MGKLAIIFPGQGSNYTGMGKEFYDKYDIVKNIYEVANRELSIDIKEVCFEAKQDNTTTHAAQLATFVSEYAMYKVYEQEIGLKPDYLAGHSLGEYVALVVAGVIDYKDALSIINVRGQLMDAACKETPGIMVAVGNVDIALVENICSEVSKGYGFAVISNYNSKNQVVISGDKISIGKCIELLKSKNALIKELKVAGSFHSPLMIDASKNFRKELNKYNFGHFKIPVISNITASLYEENCLDIRDILAKHMVMPVRWSESIEYLNENKVKVFLEIGPKNILKNIIKTNLPFTSVYAFDEVNDREKFVKYVGNSKLDIIKKIISIAICTKNNSSLSKEEYYEKFIMPYRDLFNYFKNIENGSLRVEVSEIEVWLGKLNLMLECKDIDKDEKEYRIRDLNDGTFINKYVLNYEKYFQ